MSAASAEELVRTAEAALRALAESRDPAAFTELLRMTQVVGECLAVAAQGVANAASWATVGDLAGTSRQAAWERWRAR